MKALGPRCAALLVFALVSACGSRREDAGTIGHGSATLEAAVTGTVLDAASGEPISGARIEGPDGSRAVSARDGRFVLRGLHAGTSGEILLKLGDGRTIRQKLRTLAAGTLEIVIHVPRH